MITFQHMLRNALIPIITAVGLQFGTLLGGAMLAETVFSWPGLGRLMVESIKSKDIPMVLGCVIFMATMFTIVNLLVDIVYAFVDPRIKSLYKRVGEKLGRKKLLLPTRSSAPSGRRRGDGSARTAWRWLAWCSCPSWSSLPW